ncbi:MAG TPA: universal stress protein [Kiloniellales bacterium]
MFKKILHANDGSEGAFRALAAAIGLAKFHGAELHMVSVEEIQWMPGSREEVIGEKELENHRFEDAIKRAKRQAKKQKLEITTHLLIGHPVKAIS